VEDWRGSREGYVPHEADAAVRLLSFPFLPSLPCFPSSRLHSSLNPSYLRTTSSSALPSSFHILNPPFHSVFSTLYTLDSRFVLTGSDDANLRIWKARASEKLGVVDKREQVRKEYRDGLRDKWGTVADVAKVERCVCFSTLSLSPLDGFAA
jgi:WD40 repeat protein